MIRDRRPTESRVLAIGVGLVWENVHCERRAYGLTIVTIVGILVHALET